MMIVHEGLKRRGCTTSSTLKKTEQGKRNKKAEGWKEKQTNHHARKREAKAARKTGQPRGTTNAKEATPEQPRITHHPIQYAGSVAPKGTEASEEPGKMLAGNWMGDERSA